MANSLQGRGARRFMRRRGTLGNLLLAGALLIAADVLYLQSAGSPPEATSTPMAAATEEKDWLETAKERLLKKSQRPNKPYDKPAEASDFYLQQRTGGAALDYAALAQAALEAQSMPAVTPTPSGFLLDGKFTGDAKSTIGGWTELGPGNIGGRTRALIIDPATPATMYAGGVAGGVWKTTNAGGNWAPLDDLMDNLAVTTLAFEGQGSGAINTSVIYAGTGEGYFNGDAVQGAGIFKSTDAGATWAQLASTNTGNFLFVNKLVASPNDPQTLYAATRTGVFKTVDAGTTWSVVLGNTGSGGASDTVQSTFVGMTDIEIRTDLGTDTLIASNGSFLGDGIYRSLNAGATWARVHTNANIGRSDLAIAPSNQNVMYALTANSASDHRLLNVFRSNDGGATWSPQITGGFDQTNPNWLLLSNPIIANLSSCFASSNSLLSQGWYDNIIAVAPHDEDIVFAGGVDLFRSDNGGANWGIISYWWLDPTFDEYAHADQHTIVFHPDWDGTANTTLYVGNDGGVQGTANALAAVASGANSGICFNNPSVPTLVDWFSLNNDYGVTQFYNGRPYPSTANYLGGTQDNGTLGGSDGAGLNGWVELNGGDGGYVSFNPANINTLFAETTGLSMVRSTNGGASFSDITAGITNAGFLFISPFRHDPNSADRIFYGGAAPWRSNNASSQANPNLVTWTQAGANWSGGGSASAFCVDPNNSNNVWAGTSAADVYRVTNGTTSTAATVWTNVTPAAFTTGFVSWIEVDPTDATGNTVYFTNSRFNASGRKVWRTLDGGTNWTDITSNIPNIPVHCIVVDPDDGNSLYVGTDLGVYVSQDQGGTWASMNTGGFANVVVETLEFQNPSTLYAFTHGRGAYRAAVTPTQVTISGTVLNGATGEPGVTLTGLPGSPVTDASGNYSVNVPGGFTGTATPAKAGFTFTPSSRAYTNLTADAANEDYAANPIPPGSHTISGTITNSGLPVSGVLMSGLPGNPSTDVAGLYVGTVADGFSGTVTPLKAGHTFAPVSRTYTNVTADIANDDYTVTAVSAVPLKWWPLALAHLLFGILAYRWYARRSTTA